MGHGQDNYGKMSGFICRDPFAFVICEFPKQFVFTLALHGQRRIGYPVNKQFHSCLGCFNHIVSKCLIRF